MKPKTLDTKIRRILSDPGCGDFILADAKDADMAGGMAAPGRNVGMSEGTFRTLDQYRELIRQNIRQGLVDIMLMSASTSDLLARQERLFIQSHVTPAVRANDTTDIWLAHGSVYPGQSSRPFRSATLNHAMYGQVNRPHAGVVPAVDLGLYSITFNNDVELDMTALENYAGFRLEAEEKGFRHFLEIFNPNQLRQPLEDLPRYLNDMIARTLAGVVGKGRPTFLKIPYHGPRAMEQLAGYDRSLIVGILGGASGTTFDAFLQLWEAKKYGARVALYGRMINNSEHQLTFIQHLRWLADGQIEPAEAVRSYHGELSKLKLQPWRPLEDDLRQTIRYSNYR